MNTNASQSHPVEKVWIEGNTLQETTGSARSLTSWLAVLVAVVIGLAIAVFWSPVIADDTIGLNIANTLVGTTATKVDLGNMLFSLAFAVVAGLATTFTACNCVVFSCIAPLTNETEKNRLGKGRLLLWMSLGVVGITAIYGLLGALLGKQMPSLSTGTIHLAIGANVPIRLLQSATVFVLLGLVFLLWGIFALGIAKNPLQRWTQQRPWAVPLFLGIIVGFFTVGRPYALFHKLFLYASSTGNILLAALLVALQGLANIALMALIFVVLTYGGHVERWLQANPLRARVLTGISMIGGGTFLIIYWGVRLPANFGIGWFPHF
ncbi:hypothetical protein [Tengunoibacter tsumagoiensis]|uniref:Cytochrome C biogenesis protein transmembrane domain-containing protein n=1 Tax=Tengunoibacter tsumagoiensis TaxID=2014871 RepID=A0A402A9E7_9CHLR|nr:hypothetical protein [Tengunoibacter tsumagoiensis]GCE15782.1 hypothetical protein KTT_56410 [Tengunoibacter tsumagoiensis]